VSKTARDPFAKVRAATSAHRAHHGCGAYPYGNGPLLSALAATANARRILELGTALGYTALSLAHGAPQAAIDTVEADADHVRLAHEQIVAHGTDAHINIYQGDFLPIMEELDPGYELAFFDGFTPAPALLAKLRALIRPRGVLITANLSHGGTANAVRDALLDEKKWLTAFVDEERETAISVKL
jgi:predicted O-methyltransferase YrrM